MQELFPFLSSRAAAKIVDNTLLEKYEALAANLYDRETNPEGIINLGVAENALMYEELIEFINKNLSVDDFDCTYGTGPTGSVSLRSGLAKLMNTYFSPATPVLPQHISMSSGVSAVLELVAWALANPGDGILIGRPFYMAFPHDFEARAEVNVVPVAFELSDPFAVDCVQWYEKALEEFESRPGASGRVRALVLCNPHNPLGECYTREALVALMKMCQKRGIHFISDEIYALSKFDNEEAPDAPTFTSALSIPLDGVIEPALVHVLYGMSKDWSANGFRVGAFISQHNKQVLQGFGAVSVFGWPSSISDRTWSAILNDEGFIKMWIDTNSKRLGENYKRATALLRKHGIKYRAKANAALFLWIDLSPYLSAATWEAERDLAKRLMQGGVNFGAGEDFKSESPGWFRIVFSMPWDLVEKGLNR
ncbi:putative aminotransferase [Sphaerosporella brunnea]|uniref:Putative aminotransferase n=1 Tax=Sphaerosporella brunnea TaxID=1250544 RepID=A0A5J5F7N6_9PEZI|nr:putative aminotransferase [Sphaerosporella brunnea]